MISELPVRDSPREGKDMLAFLLGKGVVIGVAEPDASNHSPAILVHRTVDAVVLFVVCHRTFCCDSYVISLPRIPQVKHYTP